MERKWREREKELVVLNLKALEETARDVRFEANIKTEKIS